MKPEIVVAAILRSIFLAIGAWLFAWGIGWSTMTIWGFILLVTFFNGAISSGKQ